MHRLGACKILHKFCVIYLLILFLLFQISIVSIITCQFYLFDYTVFIIIYVRLSIVFAVNTAKMFEKLMNILMLLKRDQK
jgi:hypothetical protein